MRILTFLTMATLISSVSIFSETHHLTFKNTTEIAIGNSFKVQQYQERLQSKKYDQKITRGSFFPSLTLQSSLNRINEPLTFDLSPVREAIIELETRNQIDHFSIQAQMKGGTAITPQSPAYSTYYGTAKGKLESSIPQFIDTLKDQQYPSASLLLVQPIFTGGRIYAANKIAKEDISATSCELDRVKNETIKEIILLCINYIIAENLVTIRESVLAGMKQHQNKAELLSEQGMIAKYHLLRAKVAVSEAERNLEADRNKLEVVKFTLKKYCNFPEQDEIAITDSLKYFSISDSVDAFENRAEKNQPVLQAIDHNQNMAKYKLTAMRGALAPQISAFGKYELFQDYLSALEPDWIVGLQMNLTLFSGGKNISAIGSASHLVKEVGDIKLAANRDIDLFINKVYKEMRSAESRFKNLDSDIELANENRRQCQSRFESGYGTSLEVIDAELVLERNKIDRLVALGEYCKAITELYTAAGSPSEAIQVITGVNQQ